MTGEANHVRGGGVVWGGGVLSFNPLGVGRGETAPLDAAAVPRLSSSCAIAINVTEQKSLSLYSLPCLLAASGSLFALSLPQRRGGLGRESGFPPCLLSLAFLFLQDLLQKFQELPLQQLIRLPEHIKQTPPPVGLHEAAALLAMQTLPLWLRRLTLGNSPCKRFQPLLSIYPLQNKTRGASSSRPFPSQEGKERKQASNFPDLLFLVGFIFCLVVCRPPPCTASLCSRPRCKLQPRRAWLTAPLAADAGRRAGHLASFVCAAEAGLEEGSPPGC